MQLNAVRILPVSYLSPRLFRNHAERRELLPTRRKHYLHNNYPTPANGVRCSGRLCTLSLASTKHEISLSNIMVQFRSYSLYTVIIPDDYFIVLHLLSISGTATSYNNIILQEKILFEKCQHIYFYIGSRTKK